MLRKLAFIVAVAALLVPVAAMADNPPSPTDQQNASQRCSAQRTQLGGKAFTAIYTTFGACVSKLARSEQQNTQTAQSQCRTEQADANFAASHGGKTFDQLYASDPQGKNAFGRCVSQKAKQAGQDEDQTTESSAKLCAAQRTAIGSSAFGLLYGTNANKANAFGKCVSKLSKAHDQNEADAKQACDQQGSTSASCVADQAKKADQAQQQATVNAAKACKAELAKDAKAFAAKYGSTASAFGKCVSTRAKAQQQTP